LRGDSVATIVPRLTIKLLGIWKDTTVTLPEGRWRNRLTGADFDGGKVAIKNLLKEFPVALLVKGAGPRDA
jgi:(1->4)-alpha-D-glucan 1-alpha-D-glucosylmutase